MEKKISVTREDVKKVLGFVAQCGTAWTIGRIFGTFGPQGKLTKWAGALGGSAIAVRLMEPIQAGVDENIDAICDLVAAIKDSVQVVKPEEKPDLEVL